MSSSTFYKVFRIKYLWQYILSFQDGLPFKEWVDGDLASKNGYLYILEHNSNLIFSEKAMDLAAKYGHFEVVKWLHQNRSEGCTQNALDGAAANGHVPIVDFLLNFRDEGFTGKAFSDNSHRLNAREDEYIPSGSAKDDIVKKLYKIKPYLNYEYPLNTPNPKLFKELFSNEPKNWSWISIRNAGCNGDLEMVEFLFQRADHNLEHMDDILHGIINSTHPQKNLIVKYLWDRDTVCDACAKWNLILTAATTGDLELVELMNGDFGSPPSESIAEVAAESGHLHIVKKFYDPNRSREIMCYAATNGHLPIVEWLYENFHEQYYQKDESPFDSAASNGHLNVVKFLLQNDPPAATAQCGLERAAMRGHKEVVEFLVENNFYQKFIGDFALESAARYGHLDITRYLLEKKFIASTNALTNAASAGNVEIFKLLEPLVIKKDLSAITTACLDRRHLPLLKYLHKNNLLDFRHQTLAHVVRGGNLNIIRFVLENYLCTNTEILVSDLDKICNDGNLSTLIYLEKMSLIKRPFDDPKGRSTIIPAARGGHLAILKWLTQFKFNVHCTRAIYHALNNGHLTVAKFLFDKGFPLPDKYSTQRLLNNICPLLGNQESAKWLRERLDICGQLD